MYSYPALDNREEWVFEASENNDLAVWIILCGEYYVAALYPAGHYGLQLLDGICFNRGEQGHVV